MERINKNNLSKGKNDQKTPSQNQPQPININSQITPITFPAYIKTRSARHTYALQYNKADLDENEKSNQNQNESNIVQNELFEFILKYEPEENSYKASVASNKRNNLNKKELEEAQNESDFFETLIDNFAGIKKYININPNNLIKTKLNSLSQNEILEYDKVFITELTKNKEGSSNHIKALNFHNQLVSISIFIQVKEKMERACQNFFKLTNNGKQTLESLKKLFNLLLEINDIVRTFQVKNANPNNFFVIELKKHVGKKIDLKLDQVKKTYINKILELIKTDQPPICNRVIQSTGAEMRKITNMDFFNILQYLKEKETNLKTIGVDIKEDCKNVIIKMKKIIGSYHVTKNKDDNKKIENIRIRLELDEYFKTLPNEILEQTSLYLLSNSYLIRNLTEKKDSLDIECPTFYHLINYYLINNTNTKINSSSRYNGLTDKEKKEVQTHDIKSRLLDQRFITNKENEKSLNILVTLMSDESKNDGVKLSLAVTTFCSIIYIQKYVVNARSCIDLQKYFQYVEITSELKNAAKINKLIVSIKKLQNTIKSTESCSLEVFEKRNNLLKQLIEEGDSEIKKLFNLLYSFIDKDNLFANASNSVSTESQNSICLFDLEEFQTEQETSNLIILGPTEEKTLKGSEGSKNKIKSDLIFNENEEITEQNEEISAQNEEISAQNLGTEEPNNNSQKNKNKRKRKQEKAKAAKLEPMKLQQEVQEEQEIESKKIIIQDKITTESVENQSIEPLGDEVIEFQIEDDKSSLKETDKNKIRSIFKKSKLDFKFGVNIMLEERMQNWTLLENCLTTIPELSTINNKLIEDAAIFLSSLPTGKLEIFYFPCTDFNEVVDLSLIRVSFKKAKLNIVEQIYYFKHMYEVATSNKPDQKKMDINGISLTHQTRAGFPTNCSVWYTRNSSGKILVYALGRHLNNTYHFDLRSDGMPEKFIPPKK